MCSFIENHKEPAKGSDGFFVVIYHGKVLRQLKYLVLVFVVEDYLNPQAIGQNIVKP